MILPSFLEYSDIQLRIKLEKVFLNIDKFQQISGQNYQNSNQNNIQKNQITNQVVNQIKKIENQQDCQKLLHFHIDFVFNEFARNRKVMQSLEQKIVFNLILEFFENYNLRLSVHLMGQNLDWKKAFEFWQSFEIPQNWQIDLFVEPKMTNLFSFKNKNLNTFGWLDKDFLQNQIDNFDHNIFENVEDITFKNIKFEQNSSQLSQKQQEIESLKQQKVLLMTVFAGISGQKLEKETQKLALEIVQKNLQIDFILDGGWKIEDLETVNDLNLKNVSLVSYSSFWQRFEKEIT